MSVYEPSIVVIQNGYVMCRGISHPEVSAQSWSEPAEVFQVKGTIRFYDEIQRVKQDGQGR